MRASLTVCAVTIGLVLVSPASGVGPYAGLTQSRAKHLGAEDLAVELITTGAIKEKQSASLIDRLQASRATFARVTCLVLPSDTQIIVGGGTPSGLKLKPYWQVSFPKFHGQIWESKANALAACTRNPHSNKVFADKILH